MKLGKIERFRWIICAQALFCLMLVFACGNDESPTPTPDPQDSPTPASSTLTPAPTSEPASPTPRPPARTPTPIPVVEASPGEVVISEIMIDPRAAGDADGEWFEVTNITQDKWFDLAGWTITDNNGKSQVIYNQEEELLLAPGRRLVLGQDANTAINGGIQVDYAYNYLDFENDTEDGVTLSNRNGIIDSVTYIPGVTFPFLEGHSISLDPQSLDADKNDVGANWCASFTLLGGSSDFGTPGAPNEECGTDADGDFYPEPMDCDDSNPAVNPGVAEDRENGIDDDCDNSVDELPAYWPGDILIAEIMYNPSGVDDVYGEWFEVYNTTVENISLNGWVIGNKDANHVILGSAVVPANGRIVLGVNSNVVMNGGVLVNYAYPGILLQNEDNTIQGYADILRIQYDNAVIDAVKYDVGGDFPAAEGASIFLSKQGFNSVSNDLGEYWCRSYQPYAAYSDYGSPGLPNPECAPDADGDGSFDQDDCDDENPNIYPGATEVIDNGIDDDCDGSIDEQASAPGQVIISEIMIDPTNVTDGSGEYVELFNTTADAVDINGWTLRDDGGDSHVIRNNGPLTLPGLGYLVLGIQADEGLNGGVHVDYQYDYDFGLDNIVDEVILENGGEIVDEVNYDVRLGWPLKAGHALNLDPTDFDALSNDQPNSWCAAVSFIPPGIVTDCGTPGSANDSCPTE